MSEDPTCPVCRKFVGCPICDRSIRGLLSEGGGCSWTQEPNSWTQNSPAIFLPVACPDCSSIVKLLQQEVEITKTLIANTSCVDRHFTYAAAIKLSTNNYFTCSSSIYLIMWALYLNTKKESSVYFLITLMEVDKCWFRWDAACRIAGSQFGGIILWIFVEMIILLVGLVGRNHIVSRFVPVRRWSIEEWRSRDCQVVSGYSPTPWVKSAQILLFARAHRGSWDSLKPENVFTSRA